MRAERDVVVGEVRRRGWVKVGFGLYRRADPALVGVPADQQDDERDDLELRADLVAWQQVLPPSGCVTHLTGAVLHGLWLPPVPAGLPVFVSQSKTETRPKRPEVLVMRHTRPIEHRWHQGVRLAAAHEVLLACARDLSLLDLVVLGDSALHTGLTTTEELRRSAARRRWGAGTLQNAIGWMDGRSESPWESLLRVFHRVCGVPVVPQHVVRDADGAFVARGDLWIVGSHMLHEYDGGVHRDRRTQHHDLARERRLHDADWSRRGYTSVDLLHRPEQVLREADRTLGRRHRVDRLDPWLAMLRESLFHPEGRARFAARLRGHTSGRSPRRKAG